MEQLVPWLELESLVGDYYARPGKGRRPYPLAVMLRVHCMQLFYNLSDPGMEDALYEIESMRRFAQLSLSAPIPDESTILKFRHLLERHELGGLILELINRYLHNHGVLLQEGTIVDATIISAPTSTKNKDAQRDPQMHQTKKGNQWYFGMKLHIGVDKDSGMIHSMQTTPANVHDITQTRGLLHGQERSCYGDSGYLGASKREELKDHHIHWQIAARPSQRKHMNAKDKACEKAKASIRAKVEHPFRTIKRQFGYAKVRYRGLAKNTNRLAVLSAFSNLLMCHKRLLTWEQSA